MSKFTLRDAEQGISALQQTQVAILDAIKNLAAASAPQAAAPIVAAVEPTAAVPAAAPATTVVAPRKPTIAELQAQLDDAQQEAKPVTPLLRNLEYPMDNSKRKVKMTVKERTAEGMLEEKTVDKTVILRDSTRAIIYPLLQQQMPLLQLQVIINGKPTQHFVNLKCGKSNCGNVQFSTERTSIPLSIVDADGQHATIEVGTPSGIYFQANQVIAYPKQ